jgi:chorismate mutase/prephenate dehydratase
MRIENGLMAAIPREQIKTLYSHPQVFGQCRNWILRNFPDADLVECSSTTKAAHLAKKYASDGAAAMGGPLSAEMAELKMLDTAIQDRATNTTRFLVIGEKKLSLHRKRPYQYSFCRSSSARLTCKGSASL